MRSGSGINKMKRLAIVIPWFGKTLIGGAEQQAYQIAKRLAARDYEVTVLTTCCRSFEDEWGVNHLPSGAHDDCGVEVLRFAVDSRDAKAFERVNSKLLNLPSESLRREVSAVPPDEAALFVSENINSSALLDHLASQGNQYDAFLFMPYLYGLILRGLPLVAANAFLQPCLHDEAYAYLPAVRELFRQARGLVFNSKGEAQLAVNLYGPGIFSKSVIVGEGIEVDEIDGNQMDAEFPASIGNVPYVLYLGRRTATKNVDMLVNAFRKFKAEHPQDNLLLVLAGPGSMSFADAEAGIVDLEIVGTPDKAQLLRHCLALFQPSRNESYSRAIMEAWHYGRPVVANGQCLATAVAVTEADGGWVANTDDEWAGMFAKIVRVSPGELDAAGRRGQVYANVNSDWDTVIDRYEDALSATDKQQNLHRNLPAIHQLLPDLSFGDAISNQAIAVRNRLRLRGHQSEIFVSNLDPRLEPYGHVFKAGDLKQDSGLIYHHSIGTELTAHARNHHGPKALIYHNVTPAEFYQPYRPGFAWMLETGRADLRLLADRFPLSVADSTFNADELTHAGFARADVLPIAVDPNRWCSAPTGEILNKLDDEIFNVLFVGRIAPNKGQDQLIEAFQRLHESIPNTRLIMVGDGKDFDPYYQKVLRTIADCDLEDHVIIAGQASEEALHAYYHTAHLYWSMSQHEGFCVPIVEAMWFDVPVLARRSSAIPETLGGAGVLFDEQQQPDEIAQLATELLLNNGLREHVLAAQRLRREAFLPAVIWKKLDEIVERMEASRN